MRAWIKSIMANDILEWPHWEATCDEEELQWFSVEIGPIDEEGTNLFQVAVATPQGLQARTEKTPFRGLVVQEFTAQCVTDAITDYVKALEAQSWQQLTVQLRTVFLWEYEGHH